MLRIALIHNKANPVALRTFEFGAVLNRTAVRNGKKYILQKKVNSCDSIRVIEGMVDSPPYTWPIRLGRHFWASFQL